MKNDPQKEQHRYLALSEIALAFRHGKSVQEAAESGLAHAVEFLDLTAGALILWNDKGEVFLKAVNAHSEDDKNELLATEENLLAMLRREHKVALAYMEISGDEPRAVFTLPLNLDEFDRKFKAARREGIIELARAMNHHNNNALLAIKGNIELILKDSANAPAELASKLKAIYESIKVIEDATKNSLKADKLPSVQYLEDDFMIGLFDEAPEDGGAFGGAFIGIKAGREPLHRDDDFLQSLAAVLSLAASSEAMKTNHERRIEARRQKEREAKKAKKNDEEKGEEEQG